VDGTVNLGLETLVCSPYGYQQRLGVAGLEHPEGALQAWTIHAAEIDPEIVELHSAVALSLFARGPAGAGLKEAERAAALDVSSAQITDMIARGLAATGRCAEARFIGEQAVGMYADERRNGTFASLPLALRSPALMAKVGEQLIRHLAIYRGGCVAPVAPR
jgi:hypothetical protein